MKNNLSAKPALAQTFDVFDTAITRLVLEPHHLHWSVGRRLREKNSFNPPEREWAKLRTEAEECVRRNHSHGEVTLEEIYGEIAATAPLNDEQRRLAISVELSEERRLVRPVAVLKARIDAAASQDALSFITDTYFGADEIRDLLSHCGYDQSSTKRIFTSSEHRQSKARGDLFPSVSQLVGFASDDVEHTGDNIIADIRRAAGHGWRTSEFGDARLS